jgi:hypothetical protein
MNLLIVVKVVGENMLDAWGVGDVDPHRLSHYVTSEGLPLELLRHLREL